ncbi:hypothetical protein FRB99_004943 [Tulasnella sp. 403]|nr:hypothetical protein FRB99_004943 [Tulasnella sp. 403]
MPVFSKLVTTATALSGVMAALWDTISKPSTHKSHLGARDATSTAYSPPSRYETFGTGIDHPLSKRAGTTSEDAALSFLRTKLGLTKKQLKYNTGFTGESATHVYIKQMLIRLELHPSYNGIEVANSVANVAIKNDKVVAYEHIASSTPKLMSAQAIATAEIRLGAKHNDWPTKQEYVLTGIDTAILTYVVQVENADHWFEAFVDAQTGEVVNVVDFVAEAAYRVVPFTEQDPTCTGFSLIKDPADLSASPDGWHQDTTQYNSTRSNNVNAHYGSDPLTGQTSPGTLLSIQAPT